MNFSKNKALKFIVGVIIVLALFQIYTLWFTPRDSQKDRQSSETVARLVLDLGNGSRRSFEGGTVAGMSVWHALVQSANAGGFDVDYRTQGEKVMVSEIAGAGEAAGRWIFYLNGKQIDSQAIALEPINGGDVIEVKFVSR
ncbi:hypothetical protein C4553_02165 [Candidatus Parcubacteria bacterium]|nr:MAG: hypothetical protein C4553_02165 [Candidatus Parcubacteria bacterium]